jgi:hypothetical protein
MIPLRLATASQEIPLGYFVDAADGNTEKTALTIANTDIKLWKNGATALANKNSGGATHLSNGIYYAVLDATDTDTIGPLVIFMHVSGALAVRLECCVYPAEVFDYLCAAAGTDYFKVDVAQIASAAVNAAASQIGVNVVNWKGSAAAAMTGDAYARLGAPAGASVAADVAALKSDTGGIKTKTDYLPSAAYLDAAVSSRSTLTAQQVWEYATRTLSSFGSLVSDIWAAAVRTLTAGPKDAEIDAIKAKTDNLPTDPASNTQVNTRLAAASYTAPDNASVSAIKAKTDKLVFDASNYLKATAQNSQLANLDAAVSTRALEAGGNLAAVKAKTDNLPTDPASNTQVNTRLAAASYTAPDNVGVTAIKAKTDNLPGDPADQSAVEAALSAAVASLKGADGDDLKVLSDQIDGLGGGAGGGASAQEIWSYAARTLTAGPKDAEIDAIKGKTDGLPTDPASQAAVLAAIAGLHDLSVGDLLAGDLSDHLSFPAHSLADLLRKLFWTLCNRLVINDATGELTAYKSDGVTPAMTGAIQDNGASTERRPPTWP